MIAALELNRIRDGHNGRLIPEDVVDEARDPRAVLHPEFIWDDAEAARIQREDHARHLIRSIVVVRQETQATPERTVRAYVNVTLDEDRHYTTVEHALSQDDLRAQVLAQALRELEAWQRKYQDLVELASLFAEIDARKRALQR